MRKIYIVTTPDGFFAQNEMPWSSMDIIKIKSIFIGKGFDVEIVDFDFLKDSIGKINSSIIIYTSSQRTEHKRYIEDVISFFDDDNFLVPSMESLKAHDNKGYQLLLSKKYNLDLIDCDYLCDVAELKLEKLTFPLVFKPANGASATGVKIVNNIADVSRAICDKDELSLRDLKRVIKKYVVKSRYNKKWEDYIAFGKQRFIVQKLLPDLVCDYKVLIFGEKYYVLKRFTAKGDFRASGSGIHSSEFDEEVTLVLNAAKDFKCKYSAHVYSLDICIYNGSAHLIEFQFTHVGPVTLTCSEFYFVAGGDEWAKIEQSSNLESEFSSSILEYINENCTLCP